MAFSQKHDEDSFYNIKRRTSEMRPLIERVFLYRDGSHGSFSSQDWSDIEERAREEEGELAFHVSVKEFNHYHYSEKYGWYRARYTRHK